MMSLVWAVLGAALPSWPGTYKGRHRRPLALTWDELHRALPWQRARRRLAARARRLRRPCRHAVIVLAPAVSPAAASWAWWQKRRQAFEPALRRAGAW